MSDHFQHCRRNFRLFCFGVKEKKFNMGAAGRRFIAGFLLPEGIKRQSVACVAMFGALDGPNWRFFARCSDPDSGGRAIERWPTSLEHALRIPDVRGWHGVMASNPWGLITQLELGNVWLKGRLPPELGLLTSLSLLDLHDNWLSGPIPTEIGLLQMLFSLQLQENRLTGKVPTELGRLTRLTVLFMNNNALTGRNPTCWLKKSLPYLAKLQV